MYTPKILEYKIPGCCTYNSNVDNITTWALQSCTDIHLRSSFETVARAVLNFYRF